MIEHCIVCPTRILSHIVILTCEYCRKSAHIRCIPVTREEYAHVMNRTHGWICMNCSSEILPFNNIIDQDKFTEALFELTSDFPMNMSTISDKLFNPMVLNDKNFNPLFESDPDIQFYNEMSTMYIDNSSYYFKDQLKQMLSESMTGNCLSIIHSNVRSLPAHQIEFESLLDYLCYIFFCHWIDRNMVNNI